MNLRIGKKSLANLTFRGFYRRLDGSWKATDSGNGLLIGRGIFSNSRIRLQIGKEVRTNHTFARKGPQREKYLGICNKAVAK
jgi:hypothetical protein